MYATKGTLLTLKNLRCFASIAQLPRGLASMKLCWQRRQPSSCHTCIFGILMASWDHTGVVVEKKGYQGSTVVWTTKENERRQHVRWLSQNYMYFWVKFTEVSGFYSSQDPSRGNQIHSTHQRCFAFCQWVQLFFCQRTVWRLHHQEASHCTS